jgi:hypothetical protein
MLNKNSFPFMFSSFLISSVSENSIHKAVAAFVCESDGRYAISNLHNITQTSEGKNVKWKL